MNIPKNIVLPFLYNEEGGIRLDGYVPIGSHTSGVTLAAGVDLGQIKRFVDGKPDEMSVLPASLQEKLRPYRGWVGDGARNLLKDTPVTISKDEADALMQMKALPFVESIRSRFDTVSKAKFDDIPDGPATVIFDLTWQYGDPWKDKNCGSVWNIAVSLDWNRLSEYLRNFPDKRFISRRRREADFCDKAAMIHNGTLIPTA